MILLQVLPLLPVDKVETPPPAPEAPLGDWLCLLLWPQTLLFPAPRLRVWQWTRLGDKRALQVRLANSRTVSGWGEPSTRKNQELSCDKGKRPQPQLTLHQGHQGGGRGQDWNAGIIWEARIQSGVSVYRTHWMSRKADVPTVGRE